MNCQFTPEPPCAIHETYPFPVPDILPSPQLKIIAKTNKIKYKYYSKTTVATRL